MAQSVCIAVYSKYAEYISSNVIAEQHVLKRIKNGSTTQLQQPQQM
jgi:hypothetical protein